LRVADNPSFGYGKIISDLNLALANSAVESDGRRNEDMEFPHDDPVELLVVLYGETLSREHLHFYNMKAPCPRLLIGYANALP